MLAAEARTLPARIETLLDELSGSGDPAVSACAEELVASVVGLYGAGLTRIIELLADPARADALIRGSAAGGLVALLSLFNMAGRFSWSSLSDCTGRKAVYVIFLW